jgi:hypothetical protein
MEQYNTKHEAIVATKEKNVSYKDYQWKKNANPYKKSIKKEKGKTFNDKNIWRASNQRLKNLKPKN